MLVSFYHCSKISYDYAGKVRFFIVWILVVTMLVSFYHFWNTSYAYAIEILLVIIVEIVEC